MDPELFGLTTLLQQTVSQVVVRPGAELGSVGISGFLFDIFDREELLLESEITDSFVEDNTAIQDQIALHPIRITLRGFVGELADDRQAIVQAIIAAVRILGNLSNLLPVLTTGADQTLAALTSAEFGVSQVINQAADVYSLYSEGSTTAEKQQNAFSFFLAMWQTRQLCTVETPWQVFNNMAIERVQPVQTGETRIVTEFSVTFKQIRTAQTYVDLTQTKANIATQPILAATAETIQNASGQGAVTTSQGNYGAWPQPPAGGAIAVQATRYDNLASAEQNSGAFQGSELTDTQSSRVLQQQFGQYPYFEASASQPFGTPTL